MFDWVLNTPVFLDVFFYMALLASMHRLLFQNVSKMQFQDYNVAQDCSFTKFLSLKLDIIFFFKPKEFLALVFQDSVTGFRIQLFMQLLQNRYYKLNSVVLYKINTFIKKQDFMVQLEVNWRKIFKPLANAIFHIFL